MENSTQTSYSYTARMAALPKHLEARHWRVTPADQPVSEEALTPEKFVQNFRKRLEETSTSPSSLRSSPFSPSSLLLSSLLFCFQSNN